MFYPSNEVCFILPIDCNSLPCIAFSNLFWILNNNKIYKHDMLGMSLDRLFFFMWGMLLFYLIESFSACFVQHIEAETEWPPFSRRHFQMHFLNENVWILLKISLKFVPKVWINNIPALVQIMAWRRPGDKPLSESMMGNSLTHICVTRPQWVNACTISE